nr:MAG TPA: Protealysin propeptide [Caudoviricetes sp.]
MSYLTPVSFSASAKSRCISCFVPPYSTNSL